MARRREPTATTQASPPVGKGPKPTTAPPPNIVSDTDSDEAAPFEAMPDFLAALAADFRQHGVEAIGLARRKQPVQYLRLVSTLLPIVPAKADPLHELSDEDLAAAIRIVREIIAREGDGAG